MRLTQLEGAELIFVRGQPPDAIYTFKHALVQDAAYNTLLRGKRQELHARIASACARSYHAGSTSAAAALWRAPRRPKLPLVNLAHLGASKPMQRLTGMGTEHHHVA